MAEPKCECGHPDCRDSVCEHCWCLPGDHVYSESPWNLHRTRTRRCCKCGVEQMPY